VFKLCGNVSRKIKKEIARLECNQGFRKKKEKKKVRGTDANGCHLEEQEQKKKKKKDTTTKQKR
jgi:hypothetical protein